jgi:serine/threonine-protein kinase
MIRKISILILAVAFLFGAQPVEAAQKKSQTSKVLKKPTSQKSKALKKKKKKKAAFPAPPPASPSSSSTSAPAPMRTTATVTTLAGSGSRGSTDGQGTLASFENPRGVAVDGSGNVYVADYDDHRIRKITPSGSVTTLAGSGSAGSADGQGKAASFNEPFGVAVDAGGNVYVADSFNYQIRKITPSGSVTTLAGSGDNGSADGQGKAASFFRPMGVAVDGSGNVYVADSNNHRIRKITAGGSVTTLAGSGSAGYGDGQGTAASFNLPNGVAVDGSGNVYVADSLNYRIRKITAGGSVTTLAGSGSAGYGDGQGTSASFSLTIGVTVDAGGNVYVADLTNNRIRKITAGGSVTTLAGSGSAGSADGQGTSASFFSPMGVAVDGSGNVYVADVTNNRIRKITISQ